MGVATVMDGDTMEIHGTRIRLGAIDTPENAQSCSDADGNAWRCGQRASLVLADRIGRSPVRCSATGRDRYGRVVADCFLGGENLNGWMVRAGWAVMVMECPARASAEGLRAKRRSVTRPCQILFGMADHLIACPPGQRR